MELESGPKNGGWSLLPVQILLQIAFHYPPQEFVLLNRHADFAVWFLALIDDGISRVDYFDEGLASFKKLRPEDHPHRDDVI